MKIRPKSTVLYGGHVPAPGGQEGLSRLMDSIGGAFGLILGMTGSCALILLFSIVSAVSAVASP